jgi:hypothetical protein
MSKRLFRTLVGLSLTMFFGVLVSFLLQGQFLPPELRSHHEADSPLTPYFLSIGFAAVATMFLYLIGEVGLMFFWRPSRLLFLVGAISLHALQFFSGHTVYTSLTNGLAAFDSLLTGFILAILYHSPISALFEKPSSEQPP